MVTVDVKGSFSWPAVLKIAGEEKDHVSGHSELTWITRNTPYHTT